jgi:hypothetical protein
VAASDARTGTSLKSFPLMHEEELLERSPHPCMIVVLRRWQARQCHLWDMIKLYMLVHESSNLCHEFVAFGYCIFY